MDQNLINKIIKMNNYVQIILLVLLHLVCLNFASLVLPEKVKLIFIKKSFLTYELALKLIFLIKFQIKLSAIIAFEIFKTLEGSPNLILTKGIQ